MLWTDLLEVLAQHQRLKQIRLQQIGLHGLGWLPIYCVVVNKIHGVDNFWLPNPPWILFFYRFVIFARVSTVALLGLETRSDGWGVLATMKLPTI
jgi:hypothetical protein